MVGAGSGGNGAAAAGSKMGLAGTGVDFPALGDKGLGKKSGPFWPQPVSVANKAAPLTASTRPQRRKAGPLKPKILGVKRITRL